MLILGRKWDHIRPERKRSSLGRQNSFWVLFWMGHSRNSKTEGWGDTTGVGMTLRTSRGGPSGSYAGEGWGQIGTLGSKHNYFAP